MRSFHSILDLQEQHRVHKWLVQFLASTDELRASRSPAPLLCVRLMVLSQIRDDEDSRDVGSVNCGGSNIRNISGGDSGGTPSHHAGLRPTFCDRLSLQTCSDRVHRLAWSSPDESVTLVVMAEGYYEPGDTSVVSRERAINIDAAVVALVREEAEFSRTTSGDYEALSIREDRRHR